MRNVTARPAEAEPEWLGRKPLLSGTRMCGGMTIMFKYSAAGFLLALGLMAWAAPARAGDTVRLNVPGDLDAPTLSLKANAGTFATSRRSRSRTGWAGWRGVGARFGGEGTASEARLALLVGLASAAGREVRLRRLRRPTAATAVTTTVTPPVTRGTATWGLRLLLDSALRPDNHHHHGTVGSSRGATTAFGPPPA